MDTSMRLSLRHGVCYFTTKYAGRLTVFSRKDLLRAAAVQPQAMDIWNGTLDGLAQAWLRHSYILQQRTPRQRLLAFFRSLDVYGKEDLETLAEAMSRNVHRRKLRMALERMNSVEDRGRAAAAGAGADWEDYPESAQCILFDSRAVSDADEIMTVCGQSMEPMFLDGDRVLVQYCTDLNYGDVGIFYVPGMGGVIKQVAHDRLHSLNPAFDDIFPYEDGAKIIGRVLGKITEDMIPDADEQALYLEAREGC